MTCPHCCTALPEGSKFCLSCGKPLPAAGRPDAGRLVPGASGDRTAAFPPPGNPTPRLTSTPRPQPGYAAADRTAMPDTPHPMPARPPVVVEPEARPRVLPLIMAALLGLLLVGGGAFWLLNRNRAPGSVAAVPVPGAGDVRPLGAPPAPTGPGVVGSQPGPGGPGVPNAVPGATGPSVAGTPGGQQPAGPGVVRTPPGPTGPNVAGAPGGAQPGPPVTTTPPGQQGGPSVVQAPQETPKGPSVATAPPSTSTGPSVVKTPEQTTTGPPVTSQPATPREPPRPQGMPEDIRRYLAFLAAVERDRQRHEAQMVNLLAPLMARSMIPPLDENSSGGIDPSLVATYDRTARQYYQAIGRFEARARQIGIPRSCVVLHQSYSLALRQNHALIVGTGRSLVRGDLGGLLQMKGTVGRQISETFGVADNELRGICGKYNMRPPFTIGDGGNRGSLFGLFGG